MSADPLVQFLTHRDQASFAALVTRTRDDVLRAAFRVLGDRDAAEDVTQDVFLKCLNPPWSADEVRSGRALLAATAVNLAKMRVRGEVRRRAREETAVERRVPDSDGLGRDEIEHVRFAVESLPEGLRQSVELRYFGGLQLAELARALDVSLSTAKERLQEARVVLRTRLSDSRYGVALAFVAGDSPISGIADPRPTSAFLARLDKLAVDGVDLSRIAADPVGKWKASYGHRWAAPAAIGALLLALGGALIGVLGADDDPSGQNVAAAPDDEVVADERRGVDERRRVTVDPGEAVDPVSAAAGVADVNDETGTDSTAPAGAASISLSIEVVDEAGNLLREGHAHLDLAGFPGFAVMEKLARWESLLNPQPLVDANPIVIDDLPDFADGISIEAAATVPGYAPARPRVVVLEAGVRATLRVVVVKESEAVLTVVDSETGAPVADAEVLFLTELDRRDIDAATPPPAPAPGIGLSDVAGRSVVGGLGEGPHNVEIRAPGYVARVLKDVEIRGETIVKLMPMREFGTVVVEVLGGDGKPAVGQRVNLDISGRDTDLVATIDVSGRCRFEGVPAGDHTAVLEIQDWIKRMLAGGVTSDNTALTEQVDVKAGAEVLLRLGVLSPAAPITVEVVGVDGSPREGVQVHIYGPLLQDTTSDSDGRVTFEALPAGEYSVHVRDGDDDSTDWTVDGHVAIATGVPGHVRVVVGDRRIQGRVVLDGSKDPIRGAMLFVSDAHDRSLMVWTDRDGRFSLGGALAGDVKISIAAGKGLITEVVHVDVRAGSDPDALTVRMRAGGSVLIRPLAGDTATYQVRLGPERRHEARVMDDGDHRVRGLPTGTYEVEVVRDGSVVARHSVAVVAGKESELDLR
jgi:RNA polymerase sigma-70 factor (ECF subfamily)